MAIRLPGFFDEIQPGLDKIGGFIQHLANPNMQQQVALRKAMLQNPELAQQLADMGPEAVEKMYGRGTSNIVPQLPKSSRQQAEEIRSGALADVLKRGPEDPIFKQLQADLAGLKTPEDMQRRAAELVEAESRAKSSKAKATVDEATVPDDIEKSKHGIIAGRAAVDNIRRTEDTRKQASEILLKARVRPGFSEVQGNLYKAVKAGVLSPEEKTILLMDPEHAKLYDRDQQDFHQEVMAQLTREGHAISRTGNRMQMEEYKARVDYTRAAQIAEQFGGNTDAILRLQKDPVALHEYANMPKPPTDPEGLANYEAAKAISRTREKLAGAAFNAADREFAGTSAKLDAIIYSDNADPKKRVAAIVEKNTIAKKVYGDAGVPVDKIPQWALRTEGTFSKDRTVIRRGGDLLLFPTSQLDVIGEPEEGKNKQDAFAKGTNTKPAAMPEATIISTAQKILANPALEKLAMDDPNVSQQDKTKLRAKLAELRKR